MQFLNFALLKRRIRGIIPMMKDKKAPLWKKSILIFGIIYLFLPVDLIPPLIPVFGWLDDVVIWLAIIYFLRDELDKYAPEDEEQKQAKSALRRVMRSFSGKDVYDVNYTVKEDSNDAPAPGNTEEEGAGEETEHVG